MKIQLRADVKQLKKQKFPDQKYLALGPSVDTYLSEEIPKKFQDLKNPTESNLKYNRYLTMVGRVFNNILAVGGKQSY